MLMTYLGNLYRFNPANKSRLSTAGNGFAYANTAADHRDCLLHTQIIQTPVNTNRSKTKPAHQKANCRTIVPARQYPENLKSP